MDRRLITYLFTVVIVTSMLSTTGCIFSPDDDTDIPPGPPPVEYPFADTKAQVLDNLETAYLEMDFDGYRECIHTDFKFLFTEADQIEFEVSTGYWERDEDLSVMERLFSGNTYTNADGENQNGMQEISVSNWAPDQDWVQESVDHPYFPSSFKATYDIYMVYHEVGGNMTHTVNTTQIFMSILWKKSKLMELSAQDGI